MSSNRYNSGRRYEEYTRGRSSGSASRSKQYRPFEIPMSTNESEAVVNSLDGYSYDRNGHSNNTNNTTRPEQRKTTPNSLTESTGKTPNSLDNSLTNNYGRGTSSGGRAAELKDEGYELDRGRSAGSGTANSGSRRSVSSSRGRPTKSYVERYNDIKQMTLNGTVDYAGMESRRSMSADRFGYGHQHTIDTSFERASSKGSNRSQPRASSLQSNNTRIQHSDEESIKTLERWESRKERKRADSRPRPRSASTSRRSNNVKDSGRANGISAPKVNRWSPQNNCYDEYDRETYHQDQYSRHHQSRHGDRDPSESASSQNNKSRSNNNTGDNSPLYDDADDEGAANIQVGHNSPLSIDHHFDQLVDEDGMGQRTPQRSSIKDDRRYNSNNSNHISNSGGRSSYVESLRNFSEGINGALARDGTINLDRFNQRDEEAASSYRPPDPLPSAYRTNGSQRQPEGRNDEEEAYEEKRVRWGAADCCRRLTGKKETRSSNDGFWKPRDYDGDAPHISTSTPSLGKSRKMYMYIAIVVCALCVVAAAVTVTKFTNGEKGSSHAMGAEFDPFAPSSIPSFQPSSYPSGSPTSRPSSEREKIIGAYLSTLTDGESNIVDSPQHQAKMWLLYEDKLNLHLPSYGSDALKSAVAERIKQRYALATVYFSMGVGEGGVVKGWLEGDECQFVGDYGRNWDGVACNDMGEVRALALGKWGLPCEYDVIYLYISHITLIPLDGANLAGSIPRQISLLRKMENLIVKNNPKLRGTIPNTVGQMSQLRQLGLYGNHLTGTVPKSVFQLNELVYLNLADNTLMGELDWEGLSYQKKLTRLILHNNFFEGSIQFHLLAKTSVSLLGLSNNLFRGVIDDTVGLVKNLEYLYLDRNKFVGQLPSTVGNLTNLVSLNLDGNELIGSLPSTIGSLSNLEYLSTKGNKLSGGLPTSIRSLTNLKTLNLASNALSGNIRYLMEMTSLENVHLYQNSFSGDIPASLFSLPNLETLFLSSNLFTGRIPAEIASAQRSLKSLYLSDNQLEGNIPIAVCELYNLGEWVPKITSALGTASHHVLTSLVLLYS